MTLYLPIRNRAALDAIATALEQYVQNTEDVEDELTHAEQAQLQEARRMQEWVDRVYISGHDTDLTGVRGHRGRR